MQTNTRAKVTNDQIIAAIEQLNAQGVRPTIRAVREHLGNTGSPNRIQPLLAAWHDKNKPAEAAQAVLSDSAQQSLAELFARERSAAVASKLEEIAELKSQLEEITQTGQQLEDENEQLTNANAKLIERANESVTLASERQQRIEQLEAELARAFAQSHEQTQQLANTAAQLAMQEQQRIEQQKKIEQQSAKLEEMRQQATAAQQAAAVAEIELQAAKESIATSVKHSEEVAKRNERLEQQLEQVRADSNTKLESMQKRLDDIQQQRNADAQQHIKLSAQADEKLNVEYKKNADLKSQIDKLRDELTAIKNAKKQL